MYYLDWKNNSVWIVLLAIQKSDSHGKHRTDFESQMDWDSRNHGNRPPPHPAAPEKNEGNTAEHLQTTFGYGQF